MTYFYVGRTLGLVVQHAKERKLNSGGCDSVVRAVASNSRVPWFESSHRQKRLKIKKKEGPGKGHLKNSGNRYNELSLKEEVPPYYGTQYLLMYLPIRCCRVGSTMDIRHRRPGFDSYQVVSVTGWLNYILVNIWSLTTM